MKKHETARNVRDVAFIAALGGAALTAVFPPAAIAGAYIAGGGVAVGGVAELSRRYTTKNEK